ncbi:hypothetical protein HPB50_014187 [Hyalomma asiaticum]|uniref:Uncharacterized protein n=1 Tax=Hyalomma asiaticum TaxID=266040 RepID=A0ACB7RTN0_HYAAI|nr:hypothetical protein HPB50_014187 [Hyalomma asiaticum]
MHRMYHETPDRQVQGLPEGEGGPHAYLVGLHPTPRESKIKSDHYAARASREELRPKPTASGPSSRSSERSQGRDLSKPETACGDPRRVRVTPKTT